MTATLNDVTSLNKESDRSSDETVAAELVKLSKEQGLSSTCPDGLLRQVNKNALEPAVNEEMNEHLGHEKDAPQTHKGNVRNGSRTKTVLTEATGQVEIEMPREGSFDPQIVKKRQGAAHWY